MPRELVHFEVLRAAIQGADDLGAGTVARLLRAHLDAALLGAVAHDAPYYYRGGESSFARVGNGLHGLENSDTFHPLKLLAAAVLKTEEPDLRALGWAWVLGMFTHAVVDQWFHPWVFFFSGDYYHPEPMARAEARRKHRLLEVYLDDWICAVRGQQCAEGSSLGSLCALRGPQLDYIVKLLGEVLTERLFFADGASEDAAQQWRGALWEGALLQAGFRDLSIGALLHLVTKLRPQKWAEFEALVRFGRVGLGSRLQGRQHYRNPVTGESCEHSLQELFEGAVGDCARVFAALEADIESGVFPAALRTLRGVSLNYGVWGAGPTAGVYFAETGLALPQMA